eukprot:TRINITY_DN165_c0_g2_i4.p1 TRINITY_DN165_c0_g2~~TRINITY_DN165_c0_g2_i4.p1  ORF type:complete len:148 (-),score=35.85 TRINITY_DN165_c0_g2_i4:39-482(-)
MDEILSRQAEKARKKKRRMAALQAGHNVDDSEEEEDNRTYTDPGTIEQMYHGNVPLEAFNMSEEIKDRVLNIEKGVINTKAGQEEDEPWLKDYDQSMKDRSYAVKMGELLKTVEKNQQFEEQEEKLCSVEKIKLLEDTSEILLWGVW